jgi:hypothetical protein
VRVVLGIVGTLLILLMLSEFFVAFLLPRRVRRDPRIAQGVYQAVWVPWRWLAHRVRPVAGDTMLGFFGPFALVLELVVWASGLILGFTCLQWAGGGSFDFAFSAGTFLSAGFEPATTWQRVVGLIEAATGVGVVFVVIGYLPSVYGAFSRREVAVSRLAARAGSPPSAGLLLARTAERGRWAELDYYLREAEEWAAEMMETHLTYPLLMYYRSQHLGQNWLSALTTIVDTSAVLIAGLEDGAAEARTAELAFAIGRHALSDLALQAGAPLPHAGRALPEQELAELRSLLEMSELPLATDERFREQLEELRATYEPKAAALARTLALRLPGWVGSEQLERKQLPAHMR